MSKPLIIAHRGSSALAPENTLAAFERAMEEDGADGIEFDVRLARDGVPVVIHDVTLQRVAGVRCRVKNITSSELAKMDVGSWFNLRHPDLAQKRFSSEGVPTLERTLQLLEDFAGLIYIELKCKAEDAGLLVDAVAKVISPSRLLPQVIVQSFNLKALPRMRNLIPTVKTAVLFGPTIRHLLGGKLRIVETAEEIGVDHLSLHHSLITPHLVKKAKEADFPITVWTVNNSRWSLRASKLGIAALITNAPGELIRSFLVENRQS